MIFPTDCADSLCMVSAPVSIYEEIVKIREAKVSVQGDQEPPAKWIRRLHPDQWYAYADEHLRSEITEAFYQVQAA